MWSKISNSCLTWSVLPSILFVASACFVLWKRKVMNFPPGPWGLPLLGYFPLLFSSNPRQRVEEMRKKYGDVFGTCIGSKYALFICNGKILKQAFNRDEFNGRPTGVFEISKDFQHIASAEGPQWRDRRRLAMKCFRRQGLATDSLQDFTLDQIKQALENMESEVSSSPNRQLNLRPITAFTTSAITASLICGKSFPSNHKFYEISQQFLKFFAYLATSISPFIFLPYLKSILLVLLTDRKGIIKSFKALEDFIWSEIDSHEKAPPEQPTDFLDFYLQERKKTSSESVSRGNMNVDGQLMIFAGADPVRATLEWFFLCMAESTHVQEKIHQEIIREFGTTGTFRYEERTKLPYTEAAILESLRYKTLDPFGVVHRTTEATTLQGYDIPKDTVVIPCLWSIHNDRECWKNPETFDPERFLQSGEVRIPDNYFPFGTGKRMCIAEKLAMMEVFTFAVSMIQRFQILPPDGGVRLDESLRVSIEAVFPIVKLIRRQDQ